MAFLVRHRAGAIGFALAVLGLLLDQGFKVWMIHGLGIAGIAPIRLLPVLELVMVWNRGISYGLFTQDTDLGRWVLAGFTLVASLAIAIWLSRTARTLPAISLGLVLAGALGNGIDRWVYGAVADFFHFHVGAFSWYVFNLADVWIVAGVAGLLYDSLAFRPKDAAKSGH